MTLEGEEIQPYVACISPGSLMRLWGWGSPKKGELGWGLHAEAGAGLGQAQIDILFIRKPLDVQRGGAPLGRFLVTSAHRASKDLLGETTKAVSMTPARGMYAVKGCLKRKSRQRTRMTSGHSILDVTGVRDPEGRLYTSSYMRTTPCALLLFENIKTATQTSWPRS